MILRNLDVCLIRRCINHQASIIRLVWRKTFCSTNIVCTIVHGDATNHKSYLKFIEKADILFTDPPYCLLERRGKKGKLRDAKITHKKIDSNTNDPLLVPRFEDIKSYTEFTRKWMSLCMNSLKTDANLIIWTNALGKQSLQLVAAEFGYQLHGEFIWAKRSKPLSANSTRNEVLLRVYESASIFTKKVYPQDPSRPWSVVTGYHDEGSSTSHIHPCHKPYQTILPLMKVWTKEDDLILDPFVGSGGIVLTALKEKRRAMGLEIVAKWAETVSREAGSVPRI